MAVVRWAMCGLRWYPYRAHGRHHPNALVCLYGHHSFRGEEQLVFDMGMPPNYVAMPEIP
jgi:hypothetical protein